MNNVCKPDSCFGCGACLNICPVNAINMQSNNEGFLNSEIISDRCARCKKCVSVCPAESITAIEKFSKKVYACLTTDNELRLESTSGGMFTELAKHIISQGGKVYGACFDKNLTVKHARAENIDELSKFKGSKYVQSDISHVFIEVLKDLSNYDYVLFSGTPCQVAAIKNYTNNHEFLYTIDLVCHGVPSPMIFNDYKTYIENSHNSTIRDILFRYKYPGWKNFSMKIEFYGGDVYINPHCKDAFLLGFLRDYINRPVCHKCSFANINRLGDITLADFWGFHTINNDLKDDDKGISLSIINSKKGMQLFNNICENITYFERDLSHAVCGNICLTSPTPLNPSRKAFWDDYTNNGFDFARKKWLEPSNHSDTNCDTREIFINNNSYKPAGEYLSEQILLMQKRIQHRAWVLRCELNEAVKSQIDIYLSNSGKDS